MKKLLLSLSAIAALTVPAFADTYKLVTDVTELDEACDVIVVGEKSGTYYAIATTTNTNNRKVVEVTLNAGMIVNPEETVGIFNVKKDADNYTFYFSNYEGTKGYLAATSSSGNYLGVVADVSDDAKAAVKIADTGLASVVFQGENTRNIMRFNSTLFACYTTTSSGVAGTDVYFYKKDENAVVKTPATLSFPETAYSAAVGTEFAAPTLDKVTDGALTWTSSNTEVATVSADGTVTPVAAGVTTITVEAAETDEYYGTNASYTLVVYEGNSFTAEFAKYGYANEDKVLSTKIGLATVDFSNGTNTSNAPAYYNTGTGIRTYKDNLVTVSVPEGYIIKSVVFEASVWALAEAVAEDADALGTLSEEKVWTPAEGVETASISFAGTGTSRIQKITVEWEALKAPVTVPSLEATDKNGVFTFEAEEGVTYTYTLNGAAEQLEVKGNTISVADLASATLYAILLHADGVAAEAPVYAVTAPVPVLEASVNDGMRMLTCAAGEGVTVYYRVVNKIVAYAAEEWTVLPAAGAEVEEGSQIEVKASALTPEEAAVESDVVALDIPTGIVSIEAEGAVKVYDLSGRAVSGELQPGIYVVVEGGKSRKVVVR